MNNSITRLEIQPGCPLTGRPGAGAGYCDSKQQPHSPGGRASAVDRGAQGRRERGRGKRQHTSALLEGPRPDPHTLSPFLLLRPQRRYSNRSTLNGPSRTTVITIVTVTINTPAHTQGALRRFPSGLVPLPGADWAAQRRNPERNERELRPGAIQRLVIFLRPWANPVPCPHPPGGLRGAEDQGKRYRSRHLGPRDAQSRPGAFAQALRPNARERKNRAAAEAPPPFPGTRRGSRPQPFFPAHRGAPALPAAPLKIRRDNALKEIKNQFIREPRRNEGGC